MLIPGQSRKDYLIPGYDLYGQTFNVCDRFNREICDKKWPFISGGRNHCGEFGHQHFFALTVTLTNIWNMLLVLRNCTALDYTFQEMCEELSNALWLKYNI